MPLSLAPATLLAPGRQYTAGAPQRPVTRGHPLGVDPAKTKDVGRGGGSSRRPLLPDVPPFDDVAVALLRAYPSVAWEGTELDVAREIIASDKRFAAVIVRATPEALAALPASGSPSLSRDLTALEGQLEQLSSDLDGDTQWLDHLAEGLLTGIAGMEKGIGSVSEDTRKTLGPTMLALTDRVASLREGIQPFVAALDPLRGRAAAAHRLLRWLADARLQKDDEEAARRTRPRFRARAAKVTSTETLEALIYGQLVVPDGFLINALPLRTLRTGHALRLARYVRRPSGRYLIELSTVGELRQALADGAAFDPPKYSIPAQRAPLTERAKVYYVPSKYESDLAWSDISVDLPALARAVAVYLASAAS